MSDSFGRKAGNTNEAVFDVSVQEQHALAPTRRFPKGTAPGYVSIIVREIIRVFAHVRRQVFLWFPRSSGCADQSFAMSEQELNSGALNFRHVYLKTDTIFVVSRLTIPPA